MELGLELNNMESESWRERRLDAALVGFERNLKPDLLSVPLSLMTFDVYLF